MSDTVSATQRAFGGSEVLQIGSVGRPEPRVRVVRPVERTATARVRMRKVGGGGSVAGEDPTR